MSQNRKKEEQKAIQDPQPKESTLNASEAKEELIDPVLLESNEAEELLNKMLNELRSGVDDSEEVLKLMNEDLKTLGSEYLIEIKGGEYHLVQNHVGENFHVYQEPGRFDDVPVFAPIPEGCVYVPFRTAHEQEVIDHFKEMEQELGLNKKPE
jgi:hypothetical protein